MSDLVLIPLTGVGTLAMTREAFAEALSAGRELIGGHAPSTATLPAEALLDADQAASLLNVTARWLEDSARAGIIPHHKLGRFIRFRVSELAAHSRVDGAHIPGTTPRPTDSQSVTSIRRLARQ